MKYIILETQTNADGTVGTFISTYDNFFEAESKYHTVLAFAALSEVPIHCVFMLADTGQAIKSERYEHLTEVQNEI